jgi:hypothetical protein
LAPQILQLAGMGCDFNRSTQQAAVFMTAKLSASLLSSQYMESEKLQGYTHIGQMLIKF